MLRFLKFMEKETGLCSGGDIWLNNKIAFSPHLVQDPPRSPILSRRGGERAGMAFRLKYREDIRIYDQSLVVSNDPHRNIQAQGTKSDMEFSEMTPAEVLRD
jgi:hypothetical protein